MAKMFYTTDEAAAKLGVSADQLKQYVTENKLREFRDGARVMFKVDQVDRLAADAKGASKGGSVGGIGLSDSGIELAPMDSGGHDGISLADSQATRGPAKEDTAAGKGGSGKMMFDTGELKPVDASAQTQIQPAVDDQLSLEGVGSGSGLLDLTRESDDTSLGAELLDEIYPGSNSKEVGGSSSGIFENASAVADVQSGPSGLENMAAPAEAPAAAPVAMMPVEVEAKDASASAFGGLALAAMIAMGITILALVTSASGMTPAWLSSIASETTNVIIFAGILVVLAGLFALVGFFVGKATAR